MESCWQSNYTNHSKLVKQIYWLIFPENAVHCSRFSVQRSAPSLQDSLFHTLRFPGLTPWAGLLRAFGAGIF
jgi:hypothetical protein